MMKVLKILGYLLGGILLLVLAGAAYIQFSGIPSYEAKKPEFTVTPDSAKIARGERLVGMVCANCHRNPETRKLSGKQMADVPEFFGTIYSANITRDKNAGLGKYSDSELVYLLRTGVKRDGSFAPPWMAKFPFMSDYDIESIIAYLRTDAPELQAVAEPMPPCEPSFMSKFLCRVAFEPLPYPEGPIEAPSESDPVAYGRYVALGMTECYSCHSADFSTNDYLHPEKSVGFFGGGNKLLTTDGQLVLSANITMDKTSGIGNWTEEQFANAVRSGNTPNGPLSDAMPRFTTLSDSEIHAIWSYLQTVPPLDHAVSRGPIAKN